MKVLTGSVFALAAAASLLSLSAQPRQGAEYRISGPYTHDNLSVFLIHGADKSTKKMLTLEEAIDEHKVVIYETRNVNELAIENVSSEDVFIESGDIVKGGAQDRTLKDDFILPSKSGRVNISAFCMEHGRWTRRGNESVGTFDSSTQAIASKQLKMAVRAKSDQTEVWNQVAQAQEKLSSAMGMSAHAAASPTSFAMTMEAPAVRRSIDGYIQELAGVVNGKKDVVGYAFAIDGKVNSADVYASHELFARLWMKKLRATSVEAVSESRTAKNYKPATVDEVTGVIQDAESGKASARQVTDRTRAVTKETGHNIVFETHDGAQKDAWVHKTYLTK